jgi:hypothetical protein
MYSQVQHAHLRYRETLYFGAQSVLSGGDLGVLISQSEVQCLAYDILRVDEELLDDTCSVCTPSPLATEILRRCHLIREK